MSAGICIMNKNAIALAADSAVTIGPHLAIHNSANKLFALSKVAPVGAIIYSNAEVMGIPVEILIKQYKRDLGQKAFDFLEEYVNDFISYLHCIISNFKLQSVDKIVLPFVKVKTTFLSTSDISSSVPPRTCSRSCP